MRTFAMMAAAGALLATPAMAATVTYDDRAAFEAALTSFDVEDLNDATVGALSASEEVSFDDFAFTTYAGTGTSFLDGTNAANIDGTTFFRGFGPGGALLNFDFEVSLTAFGFDLLGVNNDLERTQIVINGEVISLPLTTGPAERTFFGFISMSSFDQVTIQIIQGEDGSFDNVTYGQGIAPAPVPVPAAAVLVAPALLLLRRRRKA